MAGALVKLTNLEDDASPFEVHLTYRDGRASFTMPNSGTWLLNVPARGWANLLLDRANLIGFADIGADDVRPASRCFDRALHLEELLARAAYQNNFGPRACVGEGECATDTVARSGNDGHAAIEAEGG